MVKAHGGHFVDTSIDLVVVILNRLLHCLNYYNRVPDTYVVLMRLMIENLFMDHVRVSSKGIVQHLNYGIVSEISSWGISGKGVTIGDVLQGIEQQLALRISVARAELIRQPVLPIYLFRLEMDFALFRHEGVVQLHIGRGTKLS